MNVIVRPDKATDIQSEYIPGIHYCHGASTLASHPFLPMAIIILHRGIPSSLQKAVAINHCRV